MEFKERGANVYYLPLAAATRRADDVIKKWQTDMKQKKGLLDASDAPGYNAATCADDDTEYKSKGRYADNLPSPAGTSFLSPLHGK